MRPDVKPEFLAYYREQVRPLAEKCAKLFPVLKNGEAAGKYTAEEQEEISKWHDPLAAWYVGLMIGDIDRAALHGTSLNMLNSLNQVIGTLAGGSTYWDNVWKQGTDSEEAQNLKALAKALEGLASKL